MEKLRLGVIFGDKAVSIRFPFILLVPFYVKFIAINMKLL